MHYFNRKAVSEFINILFMHCIGLNYIYFRYLVHSNDFYPEYKIRSVIMKMGQVHLLCFP